MIVHLQLNSYLKIKKYLRIGKFLFLFFRNRKRNDEFVQKKNKYLKRSYRPFDSYKTSKYTTFLITSVLANKKSRQ